VKHDYIEALEREAVSASSMFADYCFPAVYFGGGSPSTMRPDDLAATLRKLKQCLNFEIGAEITIEVMPQTVGTASLSGIKAGGFNRISLSMQSSVYDELAALDCGFTVKDVHNAMVFCNRFHIKNTNLDIMYGIPGQSERSLNATLRTVEALNPSHISLYPFHESDGIIDNNDRTSPDRQTSMDDLRSQAADYLEKAGYSQYTLFHFAKPGCRSKYFVLRYQGLEYIGLGLGARSFIRGATYSNTIDLKTYINHSSDYGRIVTDVMQLTHEEEQEYLTACREMLLTD
jgi:oxygen-independent coproporphyrinogen-3 oxidase